MINHCHIAYLRSIQLIFEAIILKLSLFFCDVLFVKAHKYNHTSIFLSGICYDDCVVLLDVKNTESSKLLIIVLSKGKSKAFV